MKIRSAWWYVQAIFTSLGVGLAALSIFLAIHGRDPGWLARMFVASVGSALGLGISNKPSVKGYRIGYKDKIGFTFNGRYFAIQAGDLLQLLMEKQEKEE